jgi:hypothetical protein
MSLIPAEVEVVPDPDAVLSAVESKFAIVASADSGILERCGHWFSLARFVIETSVPEAVVLHVAPT